MSNPDPFIPIFVAGLLFLGVFLVARSLVGICRARHSRRWPRVTGIVVSRSVVPVFDHTRELSLLRGRFVTRIAYRYQVQGRDYLSSNIHIGEDKPTSREAADAAYPGYKPGEEVTVYYNLRQPHIAVLEPGIDHVDYINLVTGLGVAGLGLFALYLW